MFNNSPSNDYPESVVLESSGIISIFIAVQSLSLMSKFKEINLPFLVHGNIMVRHGQDQGQ